MQKIILFKAKWPECTVKLIRNHQGYQFFTQPQIAKPLVLSELEGRTIFDFYQYDYEAIFKVLQINVQGAIRLGTPKRQPATKKIAVDFELDDLVKQLDRESSQIRKKVWDGKRHILRGQSLPSD